MATLEDEWRSMKIHDSWTSMGNARKLMVVQKDPCGSMDINAGELGSNDIEGGRWVCMQVYWSSWREIHGGRRRYIHGDTWRFMKVHRDPMESMEIHENPLKSMEFFGYPWKLMDPHGKRSMDFHVDQWRCMKIDTYPWSIDIHEDGWRFMDIQRGPLRSIEIHRNARRSMNIHGHPWWAMEINGDQCNSMKMNCVWWASREIPWTLYVRLCEVSNTPAEARCIFMAIHRDWWRSMEVHEGE